MITFWCFTVTLDNIADGQDRLSMACGFALGDE
jgi:hypothetical protein